MRPVSPEHRLETRRRAQANYRKNHPDANRKWRLPQMYGITVEQYDEMREAQKHVCAICSRPETVVMRGKVKPLSVDHDHLTGKVRGLLCHECNVGLGKFKDNPRLLNAARHYIERAY